MNVKFFYKNFYFECSRPFMRNLKMGYKRASQPRYRFSGKYNYNKVGCLLYFCAKFRFVGSNHAQVRKLWIPNSHAPSGELILQMDMCEHVNWKFKVSYLKWLELLRISTLRFRNFCLFFFCRTLKNQWAKYLEVASYVLLSLYLFPDWLSYEREAEGVRRATSVVVSSCKFWFNVRNRG